MVLRRSRFSLLTLSCSMERSCSNCSVRDRTWFCKVSMVPVNLVQRERQKDIWRTSGDRYRIECYEKSMSYSRLYLLLWGLTIHHQCVVSAFKLSSCPIQLLIHFGMLLIHFTKNIQLLWEVLWGNVFRQSLVQDIHKLLIPAKIQNVLKLLFSMAITLSHTF